MYGKGIVMLHVSFPQAKRPVCKQGAARSGDSKKILPRKFSINMNVLSAWTCFI